MLCSYSYYCLYLFNQKINSKKDMKKLVLVCAFVIGVSAVSFAQGGGGMRRTPKEQTDRLKEQIAGITDDQATKITAIYAVQTKRIDSLRTAAGDGADMRALFPKFTPITTEANVKIKAVLNTEQATAFQKIVDERAAAMKARMQGN
jgi:protein CpxP